MNVEWDCESRRPRSFERCTHKCTTHRTHIAYRIAQRTLFTGIARPAYSAIFGELWSRKCEPPIPARSSIQLKAHILHVESLNALPTSGVSRIARRGSSSWPADSFTELECEGKEAPSHAWNGRTAHSNDLERCWPLGANPRTDRKEVGETHASSRAWPPTRTSGART